MMPVVYNEYREQNGRRRYPFADGCSLLDADGNALATDFLIDAFLYPIDLANGLYVKTIDLNARKLYVADTVTDKLHGVADIPMIEGTEHVYEVEVPYRQVGVVVYGAGLQDGLLGQTIRSFTPAGLQLCCAAYIPLNQAGVRGILTDDNDRLTGHVTIEGQDGVVTTSYIGGGDRRILRIDMVGVLPNSSEDCGGCPHIKTVCVVVEPTSAIRAAPFGAHGVALTMRGVGLDDICEAQKGQVLPDADGKLPNTATQQDPCDAPPAPIVVPPGAAEAFFVDLADSDGNFTLVAPSTLAYKNAVGLMAQFGVASSQGTPTYAIPADQLLDFSSSPPATGDSLKIMMLGLASTRRAR